MDVDLEVPSEETVRKHWKIVVGPDSRGDFDLGVMTYHSRTGNESVAWKKLERFTEDCVQQARELQLDIAQVQMEIDINSNPGTHSNPKSEERWKAKNLRWNRIYDRLSADLKRLTTGMKGWELSDSG